MRVAQIAPLFESVPPKLYGGTERVVHNLARGLEAAGAEVTVFCSGDSRTYGTMEKVWPEALRLSKRQIKDPAAYQVRMLEAVARQALDFDIIHNHYDYHLFPLARITPVPMLTTMHYRMDMPDMPAVFDYFRDVPLVSISHAQRRPAPGLNWLRTIYHGLDLEALRPPANGPRAKGYLAFLGRFSPEKSAHWAIEIARRADIPLKIAAKIDEALPEWYEQVIKPQIDGRFIEYVGEISESEKAEFLGNALALVNPINWPEPFGLAVIEAMACGTPVLTRPVGSMPELVREGKTGFLRSNIHELAALAPEAARLDRSKIRAYVEENFSIERMTREYLNAYRQLIAGQDALIEAGLAGEPRRPEPAQDGDQPPHARRVAHDRRNFLYSIDGAADRDLKGLPQG